MASWNYFDITDKYTNSDYIKFSLDGYVSYSSGSEKYIYCKDYSPFNEWKEGDRVVIDFEKTRQHGSTYDFTFYDNAIFKSWTSNPELNRVRSDYSSLQSSYSSLQSRNSNLQSEVYSLQSRNSSLQSEISSLRMQNSARDSQIAILNSQLANIQSQLKNKEGGLVTFEKSLEELRGSFAILTITSNDKDRELEKRERKIKELKGLLGKSKEEIIDYKLKNKESRLEVLIEKLEIDRGKIRELRSIYQQLFRVGVDNKQDEIDECDDKIEEIKDKLIDGGINIIDAQRLCRKCEKIAKLKVERNKLCKERFEARQEESVRMLEGGKDEEVMRRITYEKDLEDREVKQEKNEVKKLTRCGYGYSFQNNSSSLTVEEKEVLIKFYKNRKKEIEDYKREKSLRQNRPTREEKMWSLEEQLESLDNNLKADESELVFLEWRLERNNVLWQEVNEKKAQRQQSIKRLKIMINMKEQRVAELKAQVEVPSKK